MVRSGQSVIARSGCSLVLFAFGMSIGAALVTRLAGAESGNDLSTWPMARLQQTAQQAVERQQLAGAVPALEELDRRLRGSSDLAVVEAREHVLYFLAAGRLQAGDPAGAAAAFAEFLERYPSSAQAALARLGQADGWYYQSRFGEARPLYEQLAQDPRSLQRLDATQQLGLWDRWSDCCFAAGDWEGGMPVFRALQAAATRQLDLALGAEKAAKAAAYLLQAAIARQELDEALRALAGLSGRTGAIRYDLALNLALVRGGDALYDLGRYGDALHFYQQVLKPEELRRYRTEEVQRLERARNQAVLTAIRAAELSQQLMIAQQQREAVEKAFSGEGADYTGALQFRIARCYLARGRTFEGYWAFEELGRTAVESGATAQLEEALYGQVKTSAANRHADRLRTAARAYLAQPTYHRFLADVAQELVRHERAHASAEAVQALLAELATRVAAEPSLRDAPALIYLLGSTLLELEALGQLNQLFEPLLAAMAGHRGLDGVHYWLGLADVFAGRFESAMARFEEVVQHHGSGPYGEDARFRQGVCHFGLLNYSAAADALRTFLHDHPQSRLVSEAQALVGDLAAAEGRVDEALAAYAAAQETGAALQPAHMGYINHAVFQAGRLLTSNQRWSEAASWYDAYITRWGAAGRVGEALFEQGRALEFLGRTDEMLANWLRAIVRFGNDPLDTATDLMLRDYPGKYQRSKGEWPVALLQTAREDAEARGEQSLALRLEYTLRRLQAEAGSPARREQLTMASAAVLVQMAADERERDPGLALEAAERALAIAGQSPFAEEALHLLGELKARADDLAGALEAFRRAVALFPNSPRTAAARLREGDLYLKSGDRSAALEAYRHVLQTRQWRGLAWAEANYKIGMAHLEAGEFKEAFGFCQRVYVLYGHSAEWAAPAYLGCGLALEKLGRFQEAAATYRELLAADALNATPAAREAQRRLAHLP